MHTCAIVGMGLTGEGHKGRGVGRLTIEEDEAEEAGSYHDHIPGNSHAHSQPQLAHAVVKVELLHYRLPKSLAGAVRVRLLPPLCMQRKACALPVPSPLPFGVDCMSVKSVPFDALRDR